MKNFRFILALVLITLGFHPSLIAGRAAIENATGDEAIFEIGPSQNSLHSSWSIRARAKIHKTFDGKSANLRLRNVRKENGKSHPVWDDYTIVNGGKYSIEIEDGMYVLYILN